MVSETRSCSIRFPTCISNPCILLRLVVPANSENLQIKSTVPIGSLHPARYIMDLTDTDPDGTDLQMHPSRPGSDASNPIRVSTPETPPAEGSVTPADFQPTPPRKRLTHINPSASPQVPTNQQFDSMIGTILFNVGPSAKPPQGLPSSTNPMPHFDGLPSPSTYQPMQESRALIPPHSTASKSSIPQLQPPRGSMPLCHGLPDLPSRHGIPQLPLEFAPSSQPCQAPNGIPSASQPPKILIDQVLKWCGCGWKYDAVAAHLRERGFPRITADAVGLFSVFYFLVFLIKAKLQNLANRNAQVETIWKTYKYAETVAAQ